MVGWFSGSVLICPFGVMSFHIFEEKNMKRELVINIVKLGVMAAVMAAAMPELSWATTLKSTVKTVQGSMTNMPVVLSGLAYLGGGATMLHGAGLLKKHADQPTGTPLAQGLTRLSIGAVIAALPVAMQFVSNTLAQGNDNLGFKSMGEIS